MNKQIFAQYAAKKITIKALEEELDAMKPELIEAMADHDEVETAEGLFVKTSKRTWTYPADIQKEEDALKAKKKESEQTGTATYNELIYPMFKPAK